MKRIYNKKIIKKLFTNSLNPDEWQTLLENKKVREYMYNQWTEQSNTEPGNPERKKRIWEKIEMSIVDKQPSVFHKNYKRFLRAAAVLLLLFATGITGYFLSDRKASEEIVISSDIQQIETILLPDGSVVKLGAGSTLKYPSEFTQSNRSVSLNGQAFFDVCSNPERPFIVHTDQMDITVTGTSFEVFDYTAENLIETILLAGIVSVKIKHSSPDSQTAFTLSPNDKISFDKTSEKITIEKVNANTYSAWRQGDWLSFENEKLSMIIPRLEKWYGKKIICDDRIAEKYRFKFKVKNESLEKILSIMEHSSSLKHTTDPSGNHILYEE